MSKQILNYKQLWWKNLTAEDKRKIGQGKLRKDQIMRQKMEYMTLDEYLQWQKTNTAKRKAKQLRKRIQVGNNLRRDSLSHAT